MIKTRKESEEVYYSNDKVIGISQKDITKLKNFALKNERKRVRLCTHKSINDTLHEMFIVLSRDCYIRPHKHFGKVESMSILEGEANLILFSDNGDVLRVLEMGGQNSSKLFYHKIVEPVFHTLIIQTPFLVYQEVTQGPFIKSDTLYADWAPEVFDKSFMSRINQQLENMAT